jgi:hypothetical protein
MWHLLSRQMAVAAAWAGLWLLIFGGYWRERLCIPLDETVPIDTLPGEPYERLIGLTGHCWVGFVKPLPGTTLQEELISLRGDSRIDFLTMTPQERRLYVDPQWPADIQAQKAIVFNMWKPVIGYLDLNATFNPPAQCRTAQIQDCNVIRYNLHHLVRLRTGRVRGHTCRIRREVV